MPEPQMPSPRMPRARLLVLIATVLAMFYTNNWYSTHGGNWWLAITLSVAVSAIVLGLGNEVVHYFEERTATDE